MTFTLIIRHYNHLIITLAHYLVPNFHLNNESFATPARSSTNHAHVVSLHDEVLKTVENSSACCRNSAVDASLIDGLASDTGMGIDIQVTCKLKFNKYFHIQYFTCFYFTRAKWKVLGLAYNQRKTRNERPLGRDPNRSRCHHHTSVKLFWSYPMAPWISAATNMFYTSVAVTPAPVQVQPNGHLSWVSCQL